MNKDSNKTDAKAALRAEYKQRRSEIPEALRLDYSRRIAAHILQLPETAAARNVFCFISHGTEIETHSLIDRLLRDDKQVTIPRILPERRMIAVRFPGWDALTPGTLGIPAPRGDEEFPDRIDLCITPGLAFTLDGKRLGHGRGYYDRWLALHEPSATVAPAFECQIAPDLPVTAHDLPIDILATENRLLRFR